MEEKSSDSTEKSQNNIEEPASNDSSDIKCVICLEESHNKSFTDSCFHTFCYACLLAWATEKAECPLCKQLFWCILHNVRCDLSYDEYDLSSQTNRYMNHIKTASRQSEGNSSTNREFGQSQVDIHARRYDGSPFVLASAQTRSLWPSPFRRRIYRENLWVRIPKRNHDRAIDARFYQQNPACTHRLIPWLNREVVSVCGYSEASVSWVLSIIIPLLTKIAIISEEFLNRIQPLMGCYARHFVHEFYGFANSLYNMENYDARADYGIIPHPTDGHIPELIYCNVVALSGPYSRPEFNPRRLDLSSTVLSIRRFRILGGLPREDHSEYMSNDSIMMIYNFINTEASSSESSELCAFLEYENNELTSPNSDFEDMDDDEIQILKVVRAVRPRAEQTPELIDLSSDDEAPVEVIDISSDEEHVGPICVQSKWTPPFASATVSIFNQPSTSRDIPNVTFIEPSVTERDDNSQAELASAIFRPSTTESEPSTSGWVTGGSTSGWVNGESTSGWGPGGSTSGWVKQHLPSSCFPEHENQTPPRPKKLKLQHLVSYWNLQATNCTQGQPITGHQLTIDPQTVINRPRIPAHALHRRGYSDSDSDSD